MLKLYVKKTILLLVSLSGFSTSSFEQEPHLTLTPVITGLNSPIQVTNAGDGSGRLFVALQGSSNNAAVLVYNQSYVKLDTFLKVTDISTGGEQGLLSIAFHPEYGNNTSPFFGLFYVYYTNGNGDLQIARYSVSSNPDSADENSKDTVLTIPHPVAQNHNGGTIGFGPDGYLYLATGDGGGSDDPPNNAQNPNVMLGKMLRIDVTSAATAPFYTIPPDNPYVGVTSPDTLDIIYSFGLRNPFRWSFDKLTGDLWIGDVGQGLWEEIDFSATGSTAGLNYGWRCYEGNAPHITGGCGPSSNYVFPVFAYPNPGSAAVTGGVVYRGSLAANAALVGYYIGADYYSGNFHKIRPNGSGWTVYTQNALRNGVPNFGEGENGEIYVVSQFGANVSSLTVDAILPARLTSFTATVVNESVELKWQTVFEENLSQFEIEYSTDGFNFFDAGSVHASNSITGASYHYTHTLPHHDKIFYRLNMVNFDNSTELSRVVSVDKSITEMNFVRPSVITADVITLFLNNPYQTAELISMKGEIVLKQNISGRTGKIDIPAAAVPAGVYVMRLRNNESSVQQKVIIR